MEYPEHDKLNKIKVKSQEMGSFIEWLPNAGLHLCERHEHTEGCRDPEGDLACGYIEGHYYISMLRTEELLASYFDIDLRKLEDEKQQMLKYLQEKKGSEKQI